MTGLDLTRRHFLSGAGLGLGAVALERLGIATQEAGLLGAPHFPPRVKRIVYLFQSGAPSQIDLFDHKPLLQEKNGEELPDSCGAASA